MLFWVSLIILVPLALFSGYYFAKWYSPESSVACLGLSETDVTDVKAKMAEWVADKKNNPGGLKAIDIDTAQYRVMTCLLAGNDKIKSFRIYFGEDTISKIYLGYFAGVTETEVDVSKIYMTQMVSPVNCPPICDASDPIIN